MGKYSGINNAEIKAGQAAKLLFLYSLGTSVLLLPSLMIHFAKQDAWIAVLLSLPIQYGILFIYIALSERFPRLSLVQYAERLLGAWGGKVLALTYVIFFLVLASLVLNNITSFITLSVLPLTPKWFIQITFMLVVVYGVFLGIETLARTGEILFFWVLFVNLIMGISLLGQMDIHYFEPIFSAGLMRPLKGLYIILGFPVGELVFLTLILPQVKKEDRPKLKKYMLLSVLLFGLLIIALTLLLLGVLGVQQTIRSPFAIYDLAKTINIQEILVRVEILVAVVWISTVFIKLALCLYVLSVLTAQMMGLRTYRPFVIPYSLVIIPLSVIMFRNVAHATKFSEYVWSVYSVFQGIVIPLLLFVIAVVFNKRDDSDGSFPDWKP